MNLNELIKFLALLHRSKHYERALDLATETIDEMRNGNVNCQVKQAEDWVLGTLYNVRADCLRALGDFDQAVAEFPHALDYAIKSGDAELIASVMNNYAICLGKMEKYDEQIVICELILKYDMEIGNQENIGFSSHNLARAYFQVKKLQEAMTHADRAIQIRKSLPDVDEWVNSIVLKAELLMEMGRIQEAMEIISEVPQHEKRMAMPCETLRGVFGILLKITDSMVEHHDHIINNNEETIIFAALSYIDECLEKIKDKELRRAYLQRVKAIHGRAVTILLRSALLDSKKLSLAHEAYTIMENHRARVMREWLQEKQPNVSGPGMFGIAKCLQPDERLVSYWTTNNNILALVLSSEPNIDIHEFRHEGDWHKLSVQAFQELNEEMKNGGALSENATALTGGLLLPIIRTMSKANKFYIVPDSLQYNIFWPLLRISHIEKSGDGKVKGHITLRDLVPWVMKKGLSQSQLFQDLEVEIAFLPSALLLPMIKERHYPQALNNLIIANTDPDNQLPAASKEAQLVKKILPGHSQVIEKDMATKSNILSALRNNRYNIIHIGTHYAFSSDRQGGYIPLQGNEALYYQEIAEINIQANFVSLATCWSGKMHFNVWNDGKSLADAFLLAGVRSCLVSHDEIYDDSAPVFMSEFYRSLAAGVPLGKALRTAQEFLRSGREWRNSCHWANYFLRGNLNAQFNIASP